MYSITVEGDVVSSRASRVARLAKLASLITVALGMAVGLYILFGPTYMGCSVIAVPVTPANPTPTLGPQICGTKTLVEVQPIWPMPFLALAVWSLAPLLAMRGVWSGRTWPVILALIVESTTLISFGAGPYYVPFVFVPLLFTSILAMRARAGT